MHTHQNSNPTSLRVFSRFAAKGLEFFFLHLKGPNPWNFAILEIAEFGHCRRSYIEKAEVKLMKAGLHHAAVQ